MTEATYSLPRYAHIKSYIRNQIESKQWRVGDCIPSENRLAEDFSVSRMTARRAVQELTDQGLLLRSVGMGTFVAEPPPLSLSLELPDFGEQFTFTNPHYSNRIIRLDTIAADRDVASLLKITEGDLIYHSVVIHVINSIALQWEACFVTPTLVPAYLKQNYQKVTPQAYLNWALTPSRIDHQVQAVIPDTETTGAMGLATLSACLQITRRNWLQGEVVSATRCIIPGSHKVGVDLD